MANKRSINPLAVFLVGAVIVASLLAGLGLYIYRKSGAYAVDLSPADYQTNRTAIHHTSENESPKVTTDGAVNRQLVNEVDASFKFYLQEISEEAFSERAGRDAALGLPSMEPLMPTTPTK